MNGRKEGVRKLSKEEGRTEPHLFFKQRHYIALTSQKPAGSKSLDPVTNMGAIGSGPSFPTYPLAKTFNAVVVCDCCLEAIGANAEALAVSVTTSRQIDFIMVVRNAEPVMCRLGRYSCCSVSPAAIVSLLGPVRTRDCQSRICFNFIVANVDVIFISGYLPSKPIFSVFNECMLRFLHPPRTVEQATSNKQLIHNQQQSYTMMKYIVATTLMLASSSQAFAPQQQQSSRCRSYTTELQASVFDTYPGAINLFRKEFKFDPLKLSETYEPLVPWFRESELKHGRTAMLAVVGFVVQDLVRLPGDAYSFETVPKTIDAHDTLMAMGASSPMGQLVLWIGLWDLIVTGPAAYASHKGLRTPGGKSRVMMHDA